MPVIPHSRDVIQQAALALYDRGLPVVPCLPDNHEKTPKKPIWSRWPEHVRSRKDLEVALGNCRPLNIALILNQSGLMDVEHDHGEAGEAQVLEHFGGEVPKTPTYYSPRGVHRLFKRPDRLPDRAVIEIDKVEYRIGNSGACSIVPPSKGRRWKQGLSIKEVEPAELPDHVAELIRSQVNPPSYAGSEAKNKKIKGKPSGAEKLLAIATTNSELWHTPDSVAFATISNKGHREHLRIRGKLYRQFLAKLFYDLMKEVVGSQTLHDVLATLEGKAVFDGPQYQDHIRVADHEGRVIIALCDNEFRYVDVGPEGWQVVNDSPVRFRRTKRMKPLPVPERGGSLDELRPFINVTAEHWKLFVAFAVAALRPRGPYPILKLLGEHGSAKTTSARVARDLSDPCTAPTRSAPRSDRDLNIAAHNGWVCAFDNLSHITTEMSDSLCRLSTGGGCGQRTLYEDEEETVFYHQRPIILTGIEDVGIRADLVDRELVIELQPIDDVDRLPEAVFDERFEAARPRIFGALLDAVSTALKNLPDVKERTDVQWPRMADFAQWVVAAVPALGMEPDEFLAAYEANRRSARQSILDASPILPAIRKMLKRQGGSFKGTASELLIAISLGQADLVLKSRGWPKTARPLSGMLTRLAPDLRHEGYEISRGRDGDDKVWDISYTTEPDTQPKPKPESKMTKFKKPKPKPESKKPKPFLADHLRKKGYRL